MSDPEKNLEAKLDEAVEAIRQDGLSPQEVDRAAGRVRGVLSGEHSRSGMIRSCQDFQALIPDFLEGRLSEARSLFLQEHTRECLVCRRALNIARTDTAVIPAMPVRNRRNWLRWVAVAAGLVVTVGLIQFFAWRGVIPGFSGKAAALDSVRGPVFVLAGNELAPVESGAELASRQVVRTGKGGSAVLVLGDGSRVELAERTEAAVVHGWLGSTVDLGRGNVIVQAADQGTGRLMVETSEMEVTVKGTVFSVSHGMKGSRVSVIEGEVWVQRAGERTVLTPGGKFASNPRLARVSIQEDYAWSQDAAEHLAVLNEISGLTRELQAATFGDHLRFGSQLVGYLPAETLVYGAMPNLSGQLGPALQAFRERVESSPTLGTWFDGNTDPGEGLVVLDEVVAKLTAAGSMLGDEIVIAIVMLDGEIVKAAPVLLAEVTDPAGLRTFVEAEAEAIRARNPEDGDGILLLDDPSQASGWGQGIQVWIGPDRVVASPSGDVLKEVAVGTGGLLLDAPFYQTIAASYNEGADWLLAMDLQRFPASAAKAEEPRELLEVLGIDQVSSLVVERRRSEGVTENRAVLTYEGDGSGMMQWIGQPGPMGGLDFVSRDANLAAAFVVNNPAGLIEQVVARMALRHPEVLTDMQAFEETHGLNFLRDIAGPLGGEVVFALDGPMLPTPSWKLVLEVYDPGALQRTIEWAVGELSRSAQEAGRPGPQLTRLDSGGIATWELKGLNEWLTVYYQYVGGYLIAAPDPALIGRAVQQRETGYSLSSAPAFMALLPQDPRVNLSGLLYQNLAPLVDPVAGSGLAGSWGGETLQNLQQTPPMLAAMYAEPGRISVSGVGDLDSLWLNLAALRTFSGR